MEAITEDEVMKIKTALEQADKEFPGDERSLARACWIQDSTGFGEIYTFSKEGFTVIGVEDMERLRTFSRKFTIPAKEGFEGDVRRIFQCVFVYKDRVFTSELESDVSLAEYKTMLKKLNGVFIQIKKEHREVVSSKA